VIGALCGVPCRLMAEASLVKGGIGGAAHVLPTARSTPAATRVKLSLRLSKKGRSALRRSLRRGGRPVFRVRVTARDSAGRRASGTRRVVVVG
jgi:hypothetical protein